MRDERLVAEELRDAARPGRAPEVLGRRDLEEPARVHDGDAVGDGERLVVVVGDEDGRRAGGAQGLAQVEREALAQPPVERGEGLVEQEQAGARRERPRERDALALAPAERRDRAPLVPGEPDDVEQLGHARVALGARQPRDPVGDVARDVAVREELALLEHEPEPAAVHGDAREVAAVPRHGARGDRLEPRDGAQQARLAAAARPEQGEHLAGRDVERDARDRRRAGVRARSPGAAPAVPHDDVAHREPGGLPRTGARRLRRARARGGGVGLHHQNSPPGRSPRNRSASSITVAVSSASTTLAASAMP